MTRRRPRLSSFLCAAPADVYFSFIQYILQGKSNFHVITVDILCLLKVENPNN